MTEDEKRQAPALYVTRAEFAALIAETRASVTALAILTGAAIANRQSENLMEVLAASMDVIDQRLGSTAATAGLREGLRIGGRNPPPDGGSSLRVVPKSGVKKVIVTSKNTIW